MIARRRLTLRPAVAALWLGLFAAGAVAAQTAPARPAAAAHAPLVLAPAPAVPDEVALGDPKAKVTVVEYASLGCPHCAEWARDVFPGFRKAYIDTGKVRFVLREMLFGNSTLSAAGFLAARCAGPRKYFDVVDAIFLNQAAIENGGASEMLKVTEPFGLTEASFRACLQDEAALKTLEARANNYVTADKITGTPTFVIGDQTLVGGQTEAQLDAAVAAALAAARVKRH